MRRIATLLFVLPLLVAPLFAGALTLEIGNPSANPEALAKHAVVLARMTACRSPEKTSVTATAEGLVNGVRKSVPLHVISLSTPGTFAVTHEWPEKGAWAVKMIATNPDYKNYAPSVVVPVNGNLAQLAAVKHYYHTPTDAEISSSLN